MTFKNLALVGLIAVAFVACKKDNDDEETVCEAATIVDGCTPTSAFDEFNPDAVTFSFTATK